MIRYSGIVAILVVCAGCSLFEPDPPEITTRVTLNSGDIGNAAVEITVDGADESFGCAARVNEGEWIFGSAGEDSCVVPVPSSTFASGRNALQVAKAGNTKIGPARDTVVYKGSVESSITSIECALTVGTDATLCEDVVVKVNLNTAHENQMNLNVMPDGSGAISVKGLDMWGFHVRHDGYEQYHQNLSDITGAYSDDIALREVVAGTAISGAFLFRDSSGATAPIPSDQSAWLHAIYQGPAADGVGRYAAESVGVDDAQRYSSSHGAFEIDKLAGGVYELIYFWEEQNVTGTIGNIDVTPGQEKAVGDIIIDL